MTISLVRATVISAVLLAYGCAGKTQEPARPAASAEPAPPPAPAQPVPAPEPSSGGSSGDKDPGKPVGSKLVQDAHDSSKEFKLRKNDGSGHGLGKVALTVDGRDVWPPEGPGCPALVQCCDGLVGLDESLALACLLAVGRDPDCATALRTSVAVAGESGVAAPAACPR